MGSDAAFLRSPAVQKWIDGLRQQSGVDIDHEDGRLHLLAGFCESTGRTPDETVQFCFLRRRDTGERFLSVERRQTISAEIDRFVESTGRESHEFVVASNTLRSFLIHNGVFISSAAPR
jgi:hypothetical protein